MPCGTASPTRLARSRSRAPSTATCSLSVQDAGVGGSLEPIDFDEDSLSGRGLSIINRVADRWWVDMSAGTRVNAELGLTPH
ncbi:hypothetical protein [Aeromicrobium sp. UC242_57]|uniref:hypothetical protein n=1 Tax=Aeromicrobium sp. UC242_57 TaxID=3374624 RepID=UPI00379D9DA4